MLKADVKPDTSWVVATKIYVGCSWNMIHAHEICARPLDGHSLPVSWCEIGQQTFGRASQHSGDGFSTVATTVAQPRHVPDVEYIIHCKSMLFPLRGYSEDMSNQNYCLEEKPQALEHYPEGMISTTITSITSSSSSSGKGSTWMHIAMPAFLSMLIHFHTRSTSNQFLACVRACHLWHRSRFEI